jgi:predicted metalloprotease with PDZ domain
VEGPTRVGSAAYSAGIAQDDAITAIGGEKVATPEQLDAALRKHTPGDTVRVTFTRRGEVVTADVVLEEDPRIEIVTLESTGARPTATQKSFRDAWLAGR